MLEFKEVSLEDKDRLQPLLLTEDQRGCEYTFGNIFIWKDIYDTKVAYLNGGAVIRHDRHGVGYLFPVGKCDLKQIVGEMTDDADREGDTFRILASGKRDFERLDEIFPGKFRFREERDYSEYVYRSENLRELAGKKYHQKRNHISRFLGNCPNYEFKEITAENIGRVKEMNGEWTRLYAGDSVSLAEEQSAVNIAFRDFFQLGFDGGFIEDEGRILAYAMGEPINESTYCVHIEKAFHEIQGSYAIVNRDFARRFCENYALINREDDVGEEGLRKAKLSYYPEFITDKITVMPI